jgi:hypothetical protein
VFSFPSPKRERGKKPRTLARAAGSNSLTEMRDAAILRVKPCGGAGFFGRGLVDGNLVGGIIPTETSPAFEDFGP